MDQWVVQIKKELESSETSTMEREKWKKHSIYKIPACVIELNKKAYMPQAVSFGPYHYGMEHLKAMEEHKHRALIHFLKRNGKAIELLLAAMAQVEEELRESYNPLDWKEEDANHGNGFLRLMILDGCLMLEILRTIESVPGDYAENALVFSDHGRLYIMSFIRRDMLMLENQLPLMVLEKLIEFEGNKTQEEDYLNKLIIKFFSPGAQHVESFGKCLHILDVHRKYLIQNGPSHATMIPESTNGDNIMLTARELKEAGIKFQQSQTQSLQDVSFSDGELRLPRVIIDDWTESMFLNLMAFEHLHVGVGNEVTSYIFFMDDIIELEIDALILHHKGIIVNALGSDEALAKLINSMSKDTTLDPQGHLYMVQQSVCRYCKRPWNKWKKWRANLIQTYFRNPWAIVSLIAAFFLFGLTILQTGYSIADFYNDTSGAGRDGRA